MMKFFLAFLIIQFFLFIGSVTSIAQNSVIVPFTQLIAKISAWLIMLFDTDVISEGVVIRDLGNGFAVAIHAGCNGVEAVIVLVAAIIAFPSPWKYKLGGIFIGSIVVQFLNLIRVISLFYLGQWNMKIFEWAHLYIWQALIMLDVLIFFLVWLRYLPKPETVFACNE
jgi:exosortase H (IPTLxxWG-CTERM-specific)